jgi:HNH endonuclease
MAKRTCSFPGCDEKHYGRGLCDTHYARWRRTGSTELPPPRSPEGRFWAKVNKQGPIPECRPDLGPCWLWTAGHNSGGYGRFYPIRNHGVGAHRFAYESLVGLIPEGLQIDHLCRVPACVKAIADEDGPAHLEVVTSRINTNRGNGAAAVRAFHARRTHCKHGHPFDEANTWRDKQGSRHCRTCHNLRTRQARAKNR